MKQDSRAQLALYLTADHDCSYLEQERARALFVDPMARVDTHSYQALVDQGFRRSGAHVYRPACRQCHQCVPVRIPVADFQPDRSQRRNWKANIVSIKLADSPAVFSQQHFLLYRRYLEARHPGGGMAEDVSTENYRRFLIEPWGGATRFIEMWLDDRLVGVAVTDVLEQGLSAVYTFFEPTLESRGLGTFGVLAQIEICRRLGLQQLYLGYWISDSAKMTYKARFRPLEAWNGREWRRFERGEDIAEPPISTTAA